MRLRQILNTDLGTMLRSPFFRRFSRGAEPWRGPRYARKDRHERDLDTVSRTLSLIIRANVPLVGALDAASIDAPNSRVEAIMLMLRDELAAGHSLAGAMRLHPRFFPGEYVDEILVGETTGKLSATFDGLGSRIARRSLLRETLRSYASYLAFVGIAVLGISTFIAANVTPIFAEVLADFGLDYKSVILLPVELSPQLEAEDVWRVLITMALAVIAYRLVRRIPRFGRLLKKLEWYLARPIPGFGKLNVIRSLARVGNGLRSLTAAGVPTAEAVAMISAWRIHPVYADALGKIANQTNQGLSLADALNQRTLLFPRTFRTFVALGESGNMLPESLAEVSTLYEKQFERTLKTLIDILFPLLLLCVAVVVVHVASSAFLVLTSVADGITMSM